MQFDFLSRYLEEVGHPMANVLRNDLQPEDIATPWKTIENSTDCGIFAMRHMETYKGGGIGNWRCGFKKEGIQQRAQISRLRRRYARKMLMSPINTHRINVDGQIRGYMKLPHQIRRQMAANAALVIGERLAEFGALPVGQ